MVEEPLTRGRRMELYSALDMVKKSIEPWPGKTTFSIPIPVKILDLKRCVGAGEGGFQPLKDLCPKRHFFPI